MSRTFLLGLATASALAFGATPALAVDETKPAPCNGVLFSDPTGDGDRPPLVLGTGPNMDITGLFLNKRDGVTTVNLQVVNLDKSVPATALGGVDWIIYFSVGETNAYLRATTTGSEVAFEHGIDDPAQGLTPTGATPGAFFEGADGIVQMDLPETYADQEIKNIWATTAVNQIAVVAYGDAAPDGQEGPNVTPAACPGGAPVPGAPVPGATPGTGPTTLPIAFPASAGSAKKGNKARKLTFKVDAAQSISNLKLTLKKGKSTVATGALKSASGVKSVTLRLKGKKTKLKKGVYTLSASGVVDGKALKVTRSIRVAA